MADLPALRTFLAQARARIDASAYPELHVTGASRDRRGRRGPGLTQAHMDTLLGRAAGTYAALERGKTRHPGLLEAVARILQLTTDEWRGVHAFAFSTEPLEPLYPPAGLLMADRWQAVLDSQSQMAFIMDSEGQILAHNEPFRALFAPAPMPVDFLRWTLTSPAAREVLLEWDIHWAPAFVARFRTALALQAGSTILNELLEDVLADPVTARLYQASESAASIMAQAEPYRPIRHSRFGRGWMTLCAAILSDTPGARLYVAPFFDELPTASPAMPSNCPR
ncbi:MmyB family transcriptional regulator [Actinacidiphila rubida]|uniref:MmyB-like transcription regulator ligand binding domain-containing protein n=1 Tax=Actinacidiphila rubida TaxID=310780 RepID=A0A1H8S655_9ACTN|nr:helix-turn-helix transcriptional regulator [Actinacidiphila rubida]SEO74180.1 hypothetical protein SAMN05216267_103982 [Actinacidiphila rubida]